VAGSIDLDWSDDALADLDRFAAFLKEQSPELAAIVAEEIIARGGSPFDLIVFTNRPHLYGEAGEPDPSKHVYQKQPATSKIPDALAIALRDAAAQYGNIPTEFPEGFNQA
jgi:hypothetical protein